MATFTWPPSYPATEEVAPSTREPFRFGDGYSQRISVGACSAPRRWRVEFEDLTESEADAIDAFLVARGGHEAFDWTPPRGEAGKFVCRDWRLRREGYGNLAISATFEKEGDRTVSRRQPGATTQSFTWTPSRPAERATEPRVRSFGDLDTAEQRQQDGINANLTSWTVSFEKVESVEREAILTFLEQHDGRTAFSWTDPEGIAGRFVCEGWTYAEEHCGGGDDLGTIRATFEQVPDPAI